MNIFNWFPKKVPQGGLLIKAPSPTDYIAGSSPVTGKLEERLVNGIWTPYRPTVEAQYKQFSFDSMSCTSFSANNCIEYQINWMLQNNKIPASLKLWLTNNGFFKDGHFNLSDRYLAVVSGTTRQGNYFQSVWDSIRNNGAIPESMLPFGGNSWEEYHDATKITQEMKDLGKEWVKRFEVVYEWITFDNNPDFTLDQVQVCKESLKYAPLHIAVPVPGTHAITLEGIQEPTLTVFDQYPPYTNINQLNYQIHYAMRGYISVKAPEKSPVELSTPSRGVVKLGSRGIDVTYLQTSLKSLFFLTGNVDGIFGRATEAAVKKFQTSVKIKADGIVGNISWKYLDEALKKKPSLCVWKLVPELESKAHSFLSECKKAGYSLKITHGIRTRAEQEKLYNQGRTTPGKIVTNAKPGKSKHEKGAAFDVAFTGKVPYPTDIKQWKAIADIGVSLGLKAGYYFRTFKDYPHFEI